MRVLVCASGTTGDLHPLVGIAAALRRAEHDVYLLANPAYAHLAGEAGVRLEPIGKREDLDRIKSDRRAWTYKHGWKVWIRGAGLGPMRELYQRIDQLNQPRETIVVSSYLCLGARVAREKLAIPTATVHLNVHTIRSTHGVYAYPPPALLPDLLPRSYLLPQSAPLWYRRAAMWAADQCVIDPALAKDLSRFRSELGLPPINAFVRKWWNSPDLVIGLFPYWWAGFHPDWPGNVAMTGFPIWDRAESEVVSPALRAFLKEADGVIVYSPGASQGHSERHFKSFLRCCEQLGRKGLVLSHQCPRAADMRGTLRFERYVPFRNLLPHAAAVVHHAGIPPFRKRLFKECNTGARKTQLAALLPARKSASELNAV